MRVKNSSIFLVVAAGMLLVSVKTLQELRVLAADFPVNSQTQIYPSTNSVTLIEIRCLGLPMIDIGFVVAAARAHRPHPTGMAIRPRANMMLSKKFVTGLM